MESSDEAPAAKTQAAGPRADPCRYLRFEDAEFQETVIGALEGLTVAVLVLVVVVSLSTLSRRGV